MSEEAEFWSFVGEFFGRPTSPTELKLLVNTTEQGRASGVTILEYIGMSHLIGWEYPPVPLSFAERLIVEYGADVNHVNFMKNCVMIYASCAGWIQGVKLLLKHGARVNVRSLSKWTVFESAVHSGSLELVQLLAQHGACYRSLPYVIKTDAYRHGREMQQLLEALPLREERARMAYHVLCFGLRLEGVVRDLRRSILQAVWWERFNEVWDSL
jgi:hypothetical protein